MDTQYTEKVDPIIYSCGDFDDLDFLQLAQAALDQAWRIEGSFSTLAEAQRAIKAIIAEVQHTEEA